MTLALQIAAYTEWRSRLSVNVREFQGWLSENDLSDAQTDLRLSQLLERLREDRSRLTHNLSRFKPLFIEG